MSRFPRLVVPTSGTRPVLLHCPGQLEYRHAIWQPAWEVLLSIPPGTWCDDEHLTICTFSNRPLGETPFEAGLDHLKLRYRVLTPEPGTRWVNYLKLPLAWDALQTIETRYVLICDAADVLLLASPSEVVERFQKLTAAGGRLPGCRLLFGAERNAFPRGREQRTAIRAERRMAEAAGEIPFCHLNGGVVIGETEACRVAYTRALQRPRTRRRAHSEQAVWRQLHVASKGEIAIDRRWEISATCAGRYDPPDVVRLESETPRTSTQLAPSVPDPAKPPRPKNHFLLVTLDYPPFVEGAPGRGGIGAWVTDLADGLSRADQRCTVLAPGTNPEEDLLYDNRQIFRTVRLPSRIWKRYPTLTVLFQVRKLLKDRERNVIVSCDATVARRMARALPRLPVEAGAMIHGNDVLRASRSIEIRAGLERVGWVVANSRHVAELARPLLPGEIRRRVLPPFVNPRRFPEVPAAVAPALDARLRLSGRRVLLSAGRLIRRKNHGLVVEALPEVLRAHPDTLYVIAGQGPHREAIEREVHRRGLDDSVSFAGHVTPAELRVLYERAELFVMPSFENERDVEGFGIVFLEANLFSTPVVAGRSGGIPDAVEDGVNGVLVSPTDAGELARVLSGLLGDPDRLRRLGEQGRQRTLERFAPERAVREFVRFATGT
jgi:phosphatidylinositol alpha-1,6-mannosyltransferase